MVSLLQTDGEKMGEAVRDAKCRLTLRQLHLRQRERANLVSICVAYCHRSKRGDAQRLRAGASAHAQEGKFERDQRLQTYPGPTTALTGTSASCRNEKIRKKKKLTHAIVQHRRRTTATTNAHNHGDMKYQRLRVGTMRCACGNRTSGTKKSTKKSQNKKPDYEVQKVGTTTKEKVHSIACVSNKL